MTKTIKHMGMHLTEEEHAKWHAEHSDMTPEEHENFLRKMGISKEEDKKWHETHGISTKTLEAADKTVNPFAVGGGFLTHCVKKGWLIQKGKGRTAKYIATAEGRKELKKFDIYV